MTILVAAPTYRGKDYALAQYLACYEAFTYADRRLFMVDNTIGTLSYARKLRALGVETEHVEAMPDFWDTMELCWRVIVERAHDTGCEYIASIEADVFCPPDTLEVLLEHMGEHGVVSHGVPDCDVYHFPCWCLGCVLVRTDLLYEGRYLWSVPFEQVMYAGNDGRMPLLKNLLDIEHRHDGGEPGWQGAGEGKVWGSGRG